MQVVFYQRRSQEANFSIERLFADIRRALPGGIETRLAVSRFPSRGFWGRLYNMVEAAFRQGDVNHITGDVHFLTFLLHQKRTVLTIHDLVSVHRLRGFRKSIFLFFWYWLPIRRSAVVTVISESTKEDLLRHLSVPPSKLRVISNCVSSTFQPTPKKFNTTKPVVLQIGTGANKNLERVAEAIQGVSCHLRIIGRLNDQHTELLRRFGVEHSSVSNISDDQVVEEYRRCDILVFASTYEGFGLPIIEAQATGRPVVTSRINPMTEVAGESACLVDPYDVTSIREGVIKVIHDPVYRDDLVARGFKNVERFRAEVIASQYADIYREVLASRIRQGNG